MKFVGSGLGVLALVPFWLCKEPDKTQRLSIRGMASLAQYLMSRNAEI